MRGAVLVAIAAAIGNLLQGWDNATIAGAVLYIKREFHLETHPAIEGLVVATSLIGATIITTFSGPVADMVGRRPMLIASSILYFLGGLIMLWSPNVYVLLLARLVDGFGVGLAVTLVPVYISETAPPEIRGLLNTLPQFTGSWGMCMSYTMIFVMTLKADPSWRIMLGVLFAPSLVYLVLTVFFLPESPRWLVSKGRMKEARVVLEMLRGREDVSGEMALLVEGLGTAGETEIEEYVVGPAEGEVGGGGGGEQDRETVTLYGPEQGLSWVAQPVAGGRGSMLGSALGLGGGGNGGLARQGSMFDHMKDPVVALLGSVHDRLPASEGVGSMRGSTLFPNLGSMLSVSDRAGAGAGGAATGGNWDEENVAPDQDEDEEEEYLSDDEGGKGLQAPLLSRQSTATNNEAAAGTAAAAVGGQSQASMQRYSSIGGGGEAASTMGIGGGWQLAWKWTEKVGPDGVKRGGVKRMYLHEEAEGGAGGAAGARPAGGEYVHAAALVSQSMLYTKDVLIGQSPTEPAFANPPESVAAKATDSGPASRWSELMQPGVRHALFCGMMIQILQQVTKQTHISLLTWMLTWHNWLTCTFFFHCPWPCAVLWYQWRALLHATDPGPSRGERAPLKPGPLRRLDLDPHLGPHYAPHAAVHRHRNAAHGRLRPQEPAPLDHPGAHLRPAGAHRGQRGAHGDDAPRGALHGLRHRLLLLLRHGIRPHPKHPLRRDLPHQGQGPLHRHLLPDVLDRRHCCHLQLARHAQLRRPRRRVWVLRFRLLPCSRLRRAQGA